jgi:hypothetical protein
MGWSFGVASNSSRPIEILSHASSSELLAKGKKVQVGVKFVYALNYYCS